MKTNIDVEKFVEDYAPRINEVLGEVPDEVVNYAKSRLHDQHQIHGSELTALHCNVELEELLMRHKHGDNDFILFRWAENEHKQGELKAEVIKVTPSWLDVVKAQSEPGSSIEVLRPYELDQDIRSNGFAR